MRNKNVPLGLAFTCMLSLEADTMTLHVTKKYSLGACVVPGVVLCPCVVLSPDLGVVVPGAPVVVGVVVGSWPGVVVVSDSVVAATVSRNVQSHE